MYAPDRRGGSHGLYRLRVAAAACVSRRRGSRGPDIGNLCWKRGGGGISRLTGSYDTYHGPKGVSSDCCGAFNVALLPDPRYVVISDRLRGLMIFDVSKAVPKNILSRRKTEPARRN